MGCNCGKKAQNFKNIVQQAKAPVVVPLQPQPQPSTPAQHVTRAERIKLRAERMAQRSAGVEARRIAREARIKARQEAVAKVQGK